MKKLKLNDLKVQSFVTALNETSKIKGGMELDSIPCLTGIYPTLPVQNCINTESNGHNCPTEIPVCGTAVC